MDPDQDTLARTIWGEARGEALPGMQAVAAVVMNRCAVAVRYVADHAGRQHPLYGDGTAASCCKMPWQFSCWNSNDPNRAKLLAVTADDPQFVDACQIAADAIAGTLADPTGGATSYKTNALPWPSAWGPEVAPLAVIGDQSFYNLA